MNIKSNKMIKNRPFWDRFWGQKSVKNPNLYKRPIIVDSGQVFKWSLFAKN
jgi:hypothetical protein